MNTLKLPLTINNIDQTNEIVTRIVNLIMVQQIYHLERLLDGQSCTELIILISDKCSKTLMELFPIIDMVFEDYPDYCYRLYHVHQAKDSIKKGNLFFYQVCVPENLCFSDPMAELNLFSQMQSLEKVIEKARKAFNAEMTKIQAFNDGANFYWEKKNDALTAFMVHQQIELAYRAIELFAMGKDKVTHAIRVHQKHVRPYLPTLGLLFDEADDDENKLMQHLDDAYLKVRYGEGYQINQEKLLKAMEKGKEIQQKVTEIYGDMIVEFEDKLANQQPVITTCATEETAIKNIDEEIETATLVRKEILNDDYLIDIVAIITKHVDVERIYSIYHKSTSFVEKGIFQADTREHHGQHLMLLVITKEPCGPKSFNLQSFVNQSTDSAGVTLLMHSLKNLNDALLDNNPFFHQILRSDGLIYQNRSTSGSIDLPEYDQSDALNGRLVWCKRNNRAAAMLAAAVDISERDEGVVEACLISQAVEQICIGFIYATIGYRPNQHSLKHLLNICRYINPVIDAVFPTVNAYDKEILEILIDASKDLRHRHFVNVDQIDLCVIHRRCNAWMEKAKELVSENFRVLES